MAKSYKHVVLDILDGGYLSVFEWLLNCRGIENVREYEKEGKTIFSATFKNNKLISARKLEAIKASISPFSFVQMKKETPKHEWARDNGQSLRAVF